MGREGLPVGSAQRQTQADSAGPAAKATGDGLPQVCFPSLRRAGPSPSAGSGQPWAVDCAFAHTYICPSSSPSSI